MTEERIPRWRKIKDRLVNGNINLFVIIILGSSIWWLWHMFMDGIIAVAGFISEAFNLDFGLTVLMTILAAELLAHLTGNYTVIELLKWRKRTKTFKPVYFTIRLKYGRSMGHSEMFDGHIEGYVTKCYLTKEGVRYNASVFISGWTVLSRLSDEEFVRTHKNVEDLIAYYGSGGREYRDDLED